MFDNLRYGHAWAVKWGPLVEGDILDRARLDEAFATYAPEAVIHFAAYAYVGEFVADPGKYYRNNFVGSLTLLEAMRDHGVDKIVFSSTCATYGVPDKLPIREETPQLPINPYGASKAMVERLISDFWVAHALKAIVLRYFNAAGADPKVRSASFTIPKLIWFPCCSMRHLAVEKALRCSEPTIRLTTGHVSEITSMYQTWRRPTSKRSARSWTAASPLFTISATAVDSRSWKSSPPSSV